MKLNARNIFFSVPAFALLPTYVYNHATKETEIIWLEFYRQGYWFNINKGLRNLYYGPARNDAWDKYKHATSNN